MSSGKAADQARLDLKRAYETFTEGFDVPDLVRAHKLLQDTVY
jgi:hypothetical protein